MIRVPADAELADDLALVKKVAGIPQILPVRAVTAEGKKRHGDFAVALVLAYAATRRDVVEYGYVAAGEDGGEDESIFAERRRHGGRDRDILFGDRAGRLW
jgi:phage FluMu gp28-like protein